MLLKWFSTLFIASLIQHRDIKREINTVRVGDMVIEKDLEEWLRGDTNSVLSRKVIKYRLWPISNGVPTVPYVLDDSVFWYEDVINQAINHWNNHTCLNFRPKKKSDSHYVKITKLDGCWSNVGRQPDFGAQEVSIGEGCQQVETVIHELGHVVGLIHEHQRPDRDESIHVNWDNVLDRNQDQFIKWDNYIVKRYGIPYDYSSIMQYSSWGFSKNGGLTMSTTPPEYQGLLGRNGELSHRDKKAVNIAYNCIDMWSTKCVSKTCEGEGYMGPGCQCVCPPGQHGSRCQHGTGEYYSLPSCSQTVTEETSLSSPNYPHIINPGTWCVYIIDAPEGFVPLLTFKDFQFYSWGLSCNEDLLQIRHSNVYDGDVLCGEMNPGTQILGTISRMVLYLDVKTSHSRGFDVTITWANASSSPTVVNPDPGPGFPSLGLDNLLHEMFTSFMTIMFDLIVKIFLVLSYLQGNAVKVIYNATQSMIL